MQVAYDFSKTILQQGLDDFPTLKNMLDVEQTVKSRAIVKNCIEPSVNQLFSIFDPELSISKIKR